MIEYAKNNGTEEIALVTTTQVLSGKVIVLLTNLSLAEIFSVDGFTGTTTPVQPMKKMTTTWHFCFNEWWIIKRDPKKYFPN